jgi:hypothetical protein
LGLVLEDKVPDAKTVWLYREQLAQAGMTTTEFENFDSSLKDRGYLAMGGQIIDQALGPGKLALLLQGRPGLRYRQSASRHI